MNAGINPFNQIKLPRPAFNLPDTKGRKTRKQDRGQNANHDAGPDRRSLGGRHIRISHNLHDLQNIIGTKKGAIPVKVLRPL
jgi:hypothetical protein